MALPIGGADVPHHVVIELHYDNTNMLEGKLLAMHDVATIVFHAQHI